MSGGALYIALSGLQAQQQGLDVVSENVANANTPGYLSESVDMSNLVVPGSPIGDGVSVSQVVQSQSAFTRQIELSASANNSYATQLQSILGSAQNYFAEPSSSGISEQMNALWSAFSQLGTDPTQGAPRTQVIANATNLVNVIQQAAQGISSLYDQTAQSASVTISEVNKELGQVASLNAQIQAEGNSKGGANSLIDARNQILDQLAQQIGAVSTPGSSGAVNVLVGGVTLVQDSTAQTLSFNAASQSPPSTTNTASVFLSSSSTAVPVSSGSIGAMLTALNSNLPTYGGYLNGIASDLANQVNSQLAQGQSSANVSGAPLFVASSGSTIGAANIEVNPQIVSNPDLIAASSSPYSAGDGSNAYAVANLANAQGGPNALWASYVGQVGVDVSNANQLAQSASSIYQQAYSQEQAISGVDVNRELVNLVNYQQAYQAAAKVIGTIAQTLQSLMSSV
jgi:flagellar hook-associated protein 1 FlgK